MKKSAILFFLLLACVVALAQQNPYADRTHGGSDGGIVGKIADELSVSPMGQLSYGIPIPVVPGTGGMKPALSISYNSGTKHGSFGYGFDLTGISIVSRVPCNAYNDHVVGGISFSAYDRFALDGARLIEIDSRNDTTEYRTENDSHSRIFATGGKDNPTSFIVHTKAGLTYEYASSHTLTGGPADKTLYWLVRKVSDTMGNYFTVSYFGEPDCNDWRVRRIDYTGNDRTGLTPYASVRFRYTGDGRAPVTYVGGEKVQRKYVVSDISVCFGERLVRRFSMDYRVTDLKRQLVSVTESTADGERKNPTRFAWHDAGDFKVKNVKYERTAAIHKGLLTVGDFNGDGKADILVVPQDKNAGWTGWRLFMSKGDSLRQESEGQFAWYGDEVEAAVAGDFNGDGYDDIVVKRYVDNAGGFHNCDFYVSQVSADGVRFGYVNCVYSGHDDFRMQTVELDGDGMADLFLWTPGTGKYAIIRSHSEQHGDGHVPLGFRTDGDADPMAWGEVDFLDYNGDGLTDLLNRTDTGADLLTVYPFEWINKVRSFGPALTGKHTVSVGDFNGDGRSDLLVTGEEDDSAAEWTDWKFLYSRGDGRYETVSMPKAFGSRGRRIFVADINGDGFDDLYAVAKESPEGRMVKPEVYLSDGMGHAYVQADGDNVYGLDKWRFHFGDFNGDGKTDFVCTSDWDKSYWDGYQLFLMPKGQNSLLSSVTDGLGNRTAVNYKYLSDASVFTRGTTSAYPVSSAGSNWPVVSEVITPDGLGGQHTVSYRYSDLTVHRLGRGILGFGRVTANDRMTQATAIDLYETDSTVYVPVLSRTTTTISGHIASTTAYGNRLAVRHEKDGRPAVFSILPATTEERKYDFSSGVLLSTTTTESEYDRNGNMTRSVSSNGLLTTTTTNTYSDDTERWLLGRVTSSVVTKDDGMTSSTRSAGFKYDSDGLLTEESTGADGKTENAKSYVRDAYGNILRSTATARDCMAGRITTTSYDRLGRFVASATNALGHTVTYVTEETLGNVLSSTDANGIVTENAYDSFGRLTGTSTPVTRTVTSTGWSTGMPDAPARSLYFEYGQSTGGPWTLEFFDCLGRSLRKVTESMGNGRTYTDTEYDSHGRVKRTSAPYFRGADISWTTFEYDAYGRPVRQTDPDGGIHATAYMGLTTETTDPMGGLTARTTDICGRLTKVTDPLGAVSTYEYDADGHCTAVHGPHTTVTSGYDAMGRRTSLNDPDLGTSEYTYNGFGENVTLTDSHGVTTFEYDRLGRVVKEKRPGMTVTTTYDGRWKGAVDEVSSTIDGAANRRTYEYDAYGRIVRTVNSVSAVPLTTTTSYNDDNQVDIVNHSSGLSLKYTYAPCGMLTAVTDASTGKAFWTLKSVDAAGHATEEVYGNGLTTTQRYDSGHGGLVYTVTPGIQEWGFTYDQCGSLTSRMDYTRGWEEQFKYDLRHQVTQVLKNGRQTMAVMYDKAGNIIEKSDVGVYYCQKNSNRMESVNYFRRSVILWQDVRYNALNKVAHVNTGSQVLDLSYGADGSRMMSTLHDYLRNRHVERLYDDCVELEVADGTSTWTTYVRAQGRTVAMVTRVEGKAGSGQTVYFHHDHLGSVTACSDAYGNLVREMSYDIWGQRRNPDDWTCYLDQSVSGAPDAHGFCGHEHLDVLGMVNMDGRMYDPVLGRFLSPDPFVQAPDTPLGLNRYAYCMNNPLSLTDPSGYSWFSRHWKSLVGCIVGIGVSALTAGTGTGIGTAFLAGMAGGAASALTTSLLNGSNISRIAKSTLTGALWGGLSGAASNLSYDEDWLSSIFKHSFFEGGLEGLQGGNVFHGMLVGAVSSSGSKFMNDHARSLGVNGVLVASSLLGGVVSEIGGGNFANGAVTGAFSFLFNDLMHNHFTDAQIKEIYDAYINCSIKETNKGYDWININELCRQIGGDIGDISESVQNGCAIRLSHALNLSGIKIPNVKGTMKGSGNRNYFLKASVMYKYMKRWYVATVKDPQRVKNGIVFQHKDGSWVNENYTGHVDVVYRRKWASRYTHGGEPYEDHKTEVMH